MNQINSIITNHNLIRYFVYHNHQWRFDPTIELKLNHPYNQIFQNLTILEQILEVEAMILIRFPFLSTINTQIVDSILQRNQTIKSLVKDTIRQRNAVNLTVREPHHSNKIIHQSVQKIIKHLNNLIYKYNIKMFFVDSLFLNYKAKAPYLNLIELLCSNGVEHYLILLKFSKTPYMQKYQYQARLYKKTLLTLGIKIKHVILINILAEQGVIEI